MLSDMMWLITISTLLGVSSSSWVMLWVFMEMNSLVMCGLMTKELKKNKENMKPTMLYLIIQLSASIIFLLSSTMMKKQLIPLILMTMCMIMKSGSFPIHLWYMKTMSNLKMNTKSMKTIMTWQKIMPFFIMPYLNLKMMMIFLSMMSLMLPIYKMKKQSSIKSILVLSSLNNNGWFILSIMLSYLCFIVYFIIYSLSLIMTLNFMKTLKTKSFNLKKKTIETTLIILNMGSIPPSFMFMGKVIIITMMIKFNMPKEIMFTMMMMSCYFIYHYLWSTYLYLMNLPTKTQNYMINLKNKTPWALILLTMVPLFTLILG